MNIYTNNKAGFTIIETLVAITVLMIAIAGPLVVASKGLFGANITKDQMIASYLAQESMEVVKNIRDNNIYAGLNWLTGLSACTKNAPCDASALDGSIDGPSILSCAGGTLCPIYTEDQGYGHAGGTAAPFKRGFYIHNPANTGNCATDEECGVTVEVDWNEGSTPYTVVMTSEITSVLR